jgi:GntR family transcriptional regulator of vanillate catabolism
MVTRSEQAIVAIRDMILNGDLSADTHLQEIPLAQQLGVSRTPVRQALVTLEHEGLLVPGPHRGYKVRAFRPQEILDGYDVRGVLEGMACRLIVERGVPEKALARLRECIAFGDTMLAKGTFGPDDHRPWMEMNAAIHKTIVDACGNGILVSFFETTQRLPMASALHVHWYNFDDENFRLARRAHEDHHVILEAIENKQAARAEAQMCEHLRFAANCLKRYLRLQKIGVGAPLEHVKHTAEIGATQ